MGLRRLADLSAREHCLPLDGNADLSLVLLASLVLECRQLSVPVVPRSVRELSLLSVLVLNRLRYQGQQAALDVVEVLSLLLKDLLDRNRERLLLHLFEANRRVLVVLLQFLVRDARPLLDYALHDLLVFSIDALGLLPLHYVVERPRRLD